MTTLKVKYLILLLVLMSDYLNAWKFKEHRVLGEASFTKACTSLSQQFKGEDLVLLNLIPCSDIKVTARQYGLRCALSGDHIKKPIDFQSIDAETKANSWINYGALALENYEHFWPQVKHTWIKNHQLALKSAIRSKELYNENKPTEAVAECEKALIYSAYADHFLQDAFASGHGGFSRVNSLQNQSLIVHDLWNENGRMMKAKIIPDIADDPNLTYDERMLMLSKLNENCNVISGKQPMSQRHENHCQINVWKAYGDGQLQNYAYNQVQIITANSSSIKAVILAFMKGKDSGVSLVADAKFPISIQDARIQYVFPISYFDSNATITLNNSCTENGDSIYTQNDRCWIDLESSYMQPVQSDITIALSISFIPGYSATFYGGYFAYNINRLWPEYMPENLRLYANIAFSLGDNSAYGRKLKTYEEYGLNFILPNLYKSTVFSQDLDIGYALFAEDKDEWYKTTSKIEEGLYLGINTNIDILKSRLSFGIGGFVPGMNFSETELKGQVTIGWNFGAVGGGSLDKW